jgi:hypothetical protein
VTLPAFTARILRRVPIAYEDAAGVDDRPAFVRAASGIAFIDEETIAVVQDDAAFVAIGRPAAPMRAIALPAFEGRRQFSKALGNKRHKPDFESCLFRAGRVWAFGSGSGDESGRLPPREHIAMVDPRTGDARLFDASALYSMLRDDVTISGGELNIEGAALVEGSSGERVLRLFQRGNGANPNLSAATIDFEERAFFDWVNGGRPAPPTMSNIRRWSLGAHRGARLGFTDASASPRDASLSVFVASAELSPNAFDDGEVTGSFVGVMRNGDHQLAPLVDEQGVQPAIKAEGIELDPRVPGRAWVVLDLDDPERPSDLCEIALEPAF